jgi:hypothetical protein
VRHAEPAGEFDADVGAPALDLPVLLDREYDSISTPTRSLPLGANWRAVSVALCALAPGAKPSTEEAAMSTAAVDDRILMSNLTIFYRFA